MMIIKEVEKVMAQLSPEDASHLKYWLNEFQSARRYKQFKAYVMAVKILADFGKSNSNASWN